MHVASVHEHVGRARFKNTIWKDDEFVICLRESNKLMQGRIYGGLLGHGPPFESPG